jgi:hypothetical protein
VGVEFKGEGVVILMDSPSEVYTEVFEVLGMTNEKETGMTNSTVIARKSSGRRGELRAG